MLVRKVPEDETTEEVREIQRDRIYDFMADLFGNGFRDCVVEGGGEIDGIPFTCAEPKT